MNNVRHLSTAALFAVAFVLGSCLKPTDSGPAASVVTGAIIEVTQTSATISGDVTSLGGKPITDRGVCVGQSFNPTLVDQCVSAGQGEGSFTANVTELNLGSLYKVRAYATTGKKTSYGENVNFATTGVKDIDGNIYETVVIGNQTWMAENLKTSHYHSGDIIPNVTNQGDWNELFSGAWAYYDHQSSNEAVYGKLYNWFAVEDFRGLCPPSWRVPSQEDWTILSDHLGGENVAGGKMKATGTEYWLSPNTGATNDSGFTGLPGGTRIRNDATGRENFFREMSVAGHWWSSTRHNTLGGAYAFDLTKSNAKLDSELELMRDGLSVRCMRN